MLTFSHTSLIRFSGLIWLGAGIYLMQLGINLLLQVAANPSTHPHPVLSQIEGVVGGLDSAIIVAVALSLLIGLFKGRVVLAKSVNRVVGRIRTLPDPAPLAKAYSPAYIALILSMILIGVLVRGLPFDIRGIVDAAIGSALINGSMLYFRSTFTYDT